MREIIRVKNLWFKYKTNWVLQDINLSIYEKEFVALVGQNGCGKTTLVKHFNGLLKPDRGSVTVYGVDTKDTSTAELAKVVGYVFQFPDSQIFARTIYEEVSFGPKNLKFSNREIDEVVHSSLNRVGLEKSLDTTPTALSTGERERLVIADVLAMNPRVIILDEPTTGQDHITCHNVMKIARDLVNLGKTVIVISHDMELICEWAERVIVMHEGRIINNGRPKDVFSRFEMLRDIGLSPPQVSVLARSLQFEETPVTIDEMIDVLLRRLCLEHSEIC